MRRVSSISLRDVSVSSYSCVQCTHLKYHVAYERTPTFIFNEFFERKRKYMGVQERKNTKENKCKCIDILS